MAFFRWWCGEGNEMHAARVLKCGSKCAIHTAFFARRTEITIDASIATYYGHQKAFVVMARHGEAAIGVFFPGPDRPAGRRTKTTGPTTPPRQFGKSALAQIMGNSLGIRQAHFSRQGCMIFFSVSFLTFCSMLFFS